MKGRYAWDKLFSNKIFTLYRGKDYDCSQSSICQQIRNAAAQRGVSVGISDDGDYVECHVTSSNEPIPNDQLFA